MELMQSYLQSYLHVVFMDVYGPALDVPFHREQGALSHLHESFCIYMRMSKKYKGYRPGAADPLFWGACDWSEWERQFGWQHTEESMAIEY